MKFFRPLPLAAILAGYFALVAGCEARVVGSGKKASETRTVSGFHGVELAATGTLDITTGDKEEIIVEADDNLLPLIETTVKADGVLLITFKRNESIQETSPLHFKLTAKALDKITLTGSGKIHTEGKLAADHTDLALPGSGDIVLDRLETGALTVSLAGSGSIKVVAGGASSQQVRVDGSGEYEAGGFKTDTAKVSVNGSGACKVWAEKTLDVSIGGSGDVTYHGGAQVRQRVMGSGTVRALGARAI